MHRLSAAAAAAAVTTLALAGTAAAQTTTGTPPSTTAPPSTPTPAPTPPPAPAPAPATGKLGLTLEKVHGKSAAILAGDRFRIRGAVTPYVAGQSVVVRFYRGERKIASKKVTVMASKNGKSGMFVLGYRARRAGHITVRASHRATAQLATLVAKGRGVDVLPLRARPGSKGLAVRVLQRKLKALGYVVGAPGVYDARTARAVLAFRKVTGMARIQDASTEVFRKLARGAGAFKVRFPKHGHHVEADLSLQVLALINGSRVERIYPISSGKPSTPTVLGSYRVYSKTPGTNAKGMVFTSYFHGGYGIHGYAEVPTFAASHGCLRTPVPDAVSIFNWIKYGDYVDVYRWDGGPAAVSVARCSSRARMPPRANAARWRSAPPPRARMPAPSSSAPSEPSSRACGSARATAARAISGTGRSAPSCRSVAPPPSRAARNEDSMSASRGVQPPAGSGASAAARARPWISPASPVAVASEDCASIARTSTVPSRGCGRMSHHKNV